ncbi:MAG: glycosyltransferase family 2 protein [Deltaproteobacteria bacterium]|nr:glycosyltransferase family 2 protein [Deltaproteobacteria bacterium]
MRVLVIIPAYNEEHALPALLGELRALPNLDAQVTPVVIDDGSTDATAKVAEEHGARVLRMCKNLGIGGAVQSGIRLAFREGFDFAAQIDGDGQHPPGELAKLMGAAGDADLVVGYRDKGPTTLLRRIGSWWLRVVLRVTTGVKCNDPTSGFRLYGPRALALFDSEYPYDYPEPEALAIARARGLRVNEVLVTMRERQGGQSSIAGFAAAYYVFKVTIAVALAYVRARLKPRD